MILLKSFSGGREILRFLKKQRSLQQSFRSHPMLWELVDQTGERVDGRLVIVELKE